MPKPIRFSECKTLSDKLKYLLQEFGPNSSYNNGRLTEIITEALEVVDNTVEEELDDECRHGTFSAEGACHGCGYSFMEMQLTDLPQAKQIKVDNLVYMPPNKNPVGLVIEINPNRICSVVWNPYKQGVASPMAKPVAMWLLSKVD